MLADPSSHSRQAAAEPQHRARIALRQIAPNFSHRPFVRLDMPLRQYSPGRILAAVLATALSTAGAQRTNPDSARLVTRDIPNFWRAVDRAGNDTAALIAAIRADYLSHPSPGLSDWIISRLIDQNAVGQVLQSKGWDRGRAMAEMSAPSGSPE